MKRMKNQMSKKYDRIRKWKKFFHALSEICIEISALIRCYDYRTEKSQKLTDVLRKYDTFSTDFEELLKELLRHESVDYRKSF